MELILFWIIGMRALRCSCLAVAFLLLSLNLRILLLKPRPMTTYSSRSMTNQSTAIVLLNVTVTQDGVLLDAGRLRVHVDSHDGGLEIKTSQGVLVASSVASPYIRSHGAMRRLILNKTLTSTGCDTQGCFTAATLEWRSPVTMSSMTSTVRAYASLDAIVLRQHFPSPIHRTASGYPCGFIGGPAASLFNDCGLASAFPRLSLGAAYRQWLSWAGGGNSPEPAFGSFDSMVGQLSFLKEEDGGGGGGGLAGGSAGGSAGGKIARGLLTIAYGGRATSSTRTVQQALEAIGLEPPWRGASASFAMARAFCLSERRCRGFTWTTPVAPPAGGETDPPAEPAAGMPYRFRFVTDTPADGRGRVPLAFYPSAAAMNLGGLVAAPILLPCGKGLNDTVALTALGGFMSSSHEYNVATGSLDLGVLGSVDSLPADFSAEWLLTAADGFNSALRKAGGILLRKAGTVEAKQAHAAADVSLNSLGYATQQGAWYYYNTAPWPPQRPHTDGAQNAGPAGQARAQAAEARPRMWGERYATSGAFGCAVNVSEPAAQQCKSYSETIADVKRRADQVSLPYRWWLMDSWWYKKGSLNGVHTWDAPPSTFPGSDGKGGDHAIDELADATGWRIVAHTRFFAADTSYAAQNGGRYRFVVERGRYSTHPVDGGIALPVDERFWLELLGNKTRAIKLLAGLEIDWMYEWLPLFPLSRYNQWAGCNATLSNATLADAWLRALGAAAAAARVKVTYCMAWPRMLLASTESEAVTTTRASVDYYPNTPQWSIGYTSLLADALGLRPSKDLWWSSNRALGRYGRTWSRSAEHHARLHAVAATLSNGPVMLGDLVGAEDPQLILRSCRADGQLLQPDRPATPIDASILTRVVPGAVGPRGVLLSTHSDVSGQRWTYILAVGVSTYQLRPSEVALPLSIHGHVAVEANHTSAARLLDEAHALPLKSVSEWDFQLWLVAPRSTNGWAFLGEAGTKWVGVSQRRFVSVEAAPNGGLVVQCRGVGGESIQLLAVPPGAWQSIAFWHTFEVSGVTSVRINA